MRQAMTVTWKCRRCGTRGRIIYERAVSRDKSYADALKEHGGGGGLTMSAATEAHLSQISITVRRARAASTQQRLFE